MSLFSVGWTSGQATAPVCVSILIYFLGANSFVYFIAGSIASLILIYLPFHIITKYGNFYEVVVPAPEESRHPI